MKFLRENMALFLFLIALAVGGGFIILGKDHGRQLADTLSQNQEVLPSFAPEPSLTPELTAAPQNPSPKTKTIEVSSGNPRGKLVCDYQVPPTPNSQGDAKINADWNNLTAAAICLSINGETPKLMSQDNRGNGQTTVDAPWISLTANYNFLLYNHTFSQSPCSGVVISSCRINTN